MPGKPHEELSRAELLLDKREYNSALEIVERLAADEGLSVHDRLACLLFESRLRIKLAEFEKALALAEEILQTARGRQNLLLVLDTLIVKAETSWRSGRLDEGLGAVKKGEEMLQEARLGQEDQVKRRKGELLRHAGIIYWYKGDLDRASRYHQQSLTISKELDNRQGVAVSFNNLGLVCWSKGDLDLALEYYQRSLTISEELDNSRRIATSLSNMGNVYSRKGDLDQALGCHKRSLAIREALGGKQDISMSLNNLGAVYQLKGELGRAMEYYQRSLAISEDLGVKGNIALAMDNLGGVAQLKGDLNEALQYSQRALAIYRDLGMKEEIALVLAHIGEIYRKNGNPEDALEYYQQSLVLYDELGNDPETAVVLFELVCAALERKDSTLAERCLEKLQQVNERTDNRIINQRYRVAKALSLKSSTRIREKVKAGEILEQVVKEEIGDHSLTVTAMIHLCDLLLSELKMTGEDELLAKINDLTDQLLEIAEQQSSHQLLAETYLLQSKLALIELDMGRAEKLLAKAQLIAEEKGLHTLTRTVAHERGLLQSQMRKWDLIIKENPSRPEMMDLTKLDDFLEQMIQKTVASLVGKRGIAAEYVAKKKYRLIHLDLLKDSPKPEKDYFRVGIAQVGLSETGDILHELYEEHAPGLFGLRDNKVKAVRSKIKDAVRIASSKQIDILILPELTIDLNYSQLYEDMLVLAKTYKMHIIPGSYHDVKTRRNLSVVISPDGVLWEQEKHIPAIIHYKGKRIAEGIDTRATPRKIVVGKTEFGRIAIVICRDFLDMDLRIELKNSEPPIDLIVNPAFTPVTADFKAAHFDARRSIYAYCFFANVAEFGDSLIYTPEKERDERTIPSREESVIYKDIDLFRLRSERKKWEIEREKGKPFIQSTR